MSFQSLADLHVDTTTALVALFVLTGFSAFLVLRRKFAMARRRRRAAGAKVAIPVLRVGDHAESLLSADTRPMSEFNSMVEVRRHLTPLTEAEVFMALGKDQEAEALLLEAIRRSPTNISLRVKLAEVYTQRPDVTAFQSVAFKLRLITGARGQVWENICRMGRYVDPGNPEYRDMEAAAQQGSSAFAITQADSSDFADTVMSSVPAPLHANMR